MSMTFQEGRDALIAEHRKALDFIHLHVTDSPSTTNNDWAELKKARETEKGIAASIMNLNQAERDAAKFAYLPKST